MVSSGPPPDRMSISASEGELSDEDSAALPPSGTVAKPESDPEMAAMLSRAAEMVGLEWNPPPRPEPSRLDDWYLGVASRWLLRTISLGYAIQFARRPPKFSGIRFTTVKASDAPAVSYTHLTLPTTWPV